MNSKRTSKNHFYNPLEQYPNHDSQQTFTCKSRLPWVHLLAAPNRIAKRLLGCSIGSRFTRAAENGIPIAGNPAADSVIYLFMDGGMSHLDTFDLRPDNKEIQGSLTSMKTKVPGIHVTDKLPGLAAQMDKIAQIRSMTHTHRDHARAKQHIHSGYDIVSREASQSGLDTESFKQSTGLVSKFDSKFRASHADCGEVTAYTEPVRLMASEDLDGFDIGAEPKQIREMYGKSSFGQGCLLARRLVERGSRFIEVELSGWDTHTDNHQRITSNCATLDQGLSALLTDLTAKRMLERTLVVLTTEFGRSPKINGYGGRNHNLSAFTSLLMGGGVTGGAIYGKTEPDGRCVSENPVSVHDFNSTIAHALGIDSMEIATVEPDKGKPLTAIFC
jgi:hypothetical protein|tara:strand:- start:5751 stop:6914 length:1164 start_codon:yes stop_codon:yes gene_type:complete